MSRFGVMTHLKKPISHKKEVIMKKYKVVFKKIIVVEEVVVDAKNKEDAFFIASEKINKKYDGYPSIKELK